MHALPSRPWLASAPAVADDYDNQFSCSFQPKIVLLSMLAALLCLICFVLLYVQNCRSLVLRLLGRRTEATATEAAAAAAGSDSSTTSYFNLFGRGPHPVVGLPQQVIDLLPRFAFGSIQHLVQHEKQQQQQWLECPVCLSWYESDDLLRLLPRCRHAFHALCIDKWLASTASCPLCRCLVSVNDVLNLQLVNAAPASAAQLGGAELEVIIGMGRSHKQEQPSASSSSSLSCTKV